MTTEAGVLIVSTVADVATDHVVKRLSEYGVPLQRLNTEDLPFEGTLAFEVDSEHPPCLTINGDDQPRPRSVWYRRVRTPPKPDDMQEGVYDFCLRENRAALLGGLLSLETRWMSYPADVWRAEFKPFQLAVAAELGLVIPPTVVTNDPSRIRRAFETFGEMIVKPAMSGHVVYDGKGHSIYTSRLLREHLDSLESARLSPSIYQGQIAKRFDIRATVVGDQIFAAAIDSQSDPSAAVDWRQTTNPDLPHHRVALPDEVCLKLRLLMQRLNLTFGAIDLVQTPTSEFVFLEVNPSGQWLWLDDQLDLGISEAIARWLMGR